MLILSRRVGQWIQVGDNIRVHVVEKRWGEMRIGIEAPPEVKILRSELVERDESAERELDELE
jgi:carbon storage regulator